MKLWYNLCAAMLIATLALCTGCCKTCSKTRCKHAKPQTIERYDDRNLVKQGGLACNK